MDSIVAILFLGSVTSIFVWMLLVLESVHKDRPFPSKRLLIAGIVLMLFGIVLFPTKAAAAEAPCRCETQQVQFEKEMEIEAQNFARRVLRILNQQFTQLEKELQEKQKEVKK